MRRDLSECLWTHSLDVDTLVPNSSDFLTWNTNISVHPGWNLLHIYTIVSLVGHLLRPLVLFLYIELFNNQIFLSTTINTKIFTWWLSIPFLQSPSSTLSKPHIKYNYDFQNIKYNTFFQTSQILQVISNIDIILVHSKQRPHSYSSTWQTLSQHLWAHLW